MVGTFLNNRDFLNFTFFKKGIVADCLYDVELIDCKDKLRIQT